MFLGTPAAITAIDPQDQLLRVAVPSTVHGPTTPTRFVFHIVNARIPLRSGTIRLYLVTGGRDVLLGSDGVNFDTPTTVSLNVFTSPPADAVIAIASSNCIFVRIEFANGSLVRGIKADAITILRAY